MGLRSWLRSTFGAPVAEVAPVQEAAVDGPPSARQVRRAGYEYGVVLAGGNASVQVSAGQERQQVLTQLHQAYLTCIWVSSPIDVIARTVTAGGLQVVSDDDVPEGETPADPPPVRRLKKLLRFTNPREDMIQLLRNVVTDLVLFGDAFIEIVTLLGEPVALYTLDATTMTVIADPHGEVTGYVQQVDSGRQAEFKPNQVIHISLDAPRGGLYGVSPAQKALLPVTAWLFTEATIKETFRRGDPPRVHVDLHNMQDTDVQRWREQYMVNNLGPKAVGTPVTTTGGGIVNVLAPRQVVDYLETARQLRDEIISCFGVPPAKLGIIETGNLGGGTGEAQDKTFRVNTVIPIANLVLEKLNFHLLQQGFGIGDWQLEFGEIDMRDSKVVEEIREIRLRNGAYTINRWRDEIGEPPIEGGDDPIFVERQIVVTWDDMQRLSDATIAGTQKAPAAGQSEPASGTPPEDEPPAMRDPEDSPGLPKDATQGRAPRESGFVADQWRLNEAWYRAYRARRRQALDSLPAVEEVAA